MTKNSFQKKLFDGPKWICMVIQFHSSKTCNISAIMFIYCSGNNEKVLKNTI